MKIILRIFVVLLVIGFIGGEAALIIKAIDSGPAAAPAGQTGQSSNNGKVLNREQPSQGASGQAKQGSSPVTLKVTLENLGKMSLIVLGVWGIEKLSKNKRRQKSVPFQSFYGPDNKIERYLKGATFLPRPNYDLVGKCEG